MSIYEKLKTIQISLKVPKGKFNDFGKYHYRSCEDILEALKPHLEAQNCTIVINDDIVLVGDRHYIKATVTLRDCETGEEVTSQAFAREAQQKKGSDDAQLTGACSTYARKYALNGMFCIDDARDPDSESGETKKATATPVPAAQTQQSAECVCGNCGKTISSIRNREGKVMTAEQILYKYGMCYSCAKKLKEGNNNATQNG